jgi:polysaccharide biosynthesis protein PslH
MNVNMQPKIMIFLSRIPWPLEKGDKLRAYHQIRHLSNNFSIILCCLHHDKEHAEARKMLNPFCEEIHFIKLSRISSLQQLVKAIFTGMPFQVAWFFNKSAFRTTLSLFEQHQPSTIYCQLVRTAPYGLGLNTHKVLDYQDALSEGMARQAETARGLKRALLKSESRRLKKYESFVFDKFHKKIIISEPDRELIPHPAKDEIIIIRNGIDTEYYRPSKRSKDIDILFTGNMNYPPNILAAEFLVGKILPLVEKERGATTVMLAGATPHSRVKALAASNVIVTGWVDDMRECYSRARVFTAPMTIGTGLQNKLLEAMAMEIPCVTSILANDALKAENKVNILIGEQAEEYALHIIQLLNNNNDFAVTIAVNSRAFVYDNFSWEAAGNSLSREIK